MADALQMKFSKAFSWKKNLVFDSNFTENFHNTKSNNKAVLDYAMAWRRTGDKLVSVQMMTQLTSAY